MSVVVLFSFVGSFSTKPIMVATIIVILLFMPLLTRSRNGSNYYYYILICYSTYAITSFFTPISRLSICVFSPIASKYHLLYSYEGGKLDHIVSTFSDNPQCPRFHPSFNELAYSRLQGSDSDDNSGLSSSSPVVGHHSSPSMVPTPTAEDIALESWYILNSIIGLKRLAVQTKKSVGGRGLFWTSSDSVTVA